MAIHLGFLPASAHVLAPECCMHFQRQFGKHSAQPRSLHSQLSRTESQMSCLNESHACAIVCAENFRTRRSFFQACSHDLYHSKAKCGNLSVLSLMYVWFAVHVRALFPTRFCCVLQTGHRQCCELAETASESAGVFIASVSIWLRTVSACNCKCDEKVEQDFDRAYPTVS